MKTISRLFSLILCVLLLPITIVIWNSTLKWEERVLQLKLPISIRFLFDWNCLVSDWCILFKKITLIYVMYNHKEM